MNTCTNKKRMTRTNLSVIYHSIEKNIQLAVGGFVGIERWSHLHLTSSFKKCEYHTSCHLYWLDLLLKYSLYATINEDCLNERNKDL